MRKSAVLMAGLLSLALPAACTSVPPRPSDESAESDENIVPDVYMTAYTWFDNTPAASPDISHPVVHREAGGTGTYEDPVTLAVGHSLKTGKDVLDIPSGTRIYIPNVRRYFIVEDTCGDGPTPEDGPCHLGAKGYGASVWIDMWIGGEGESSSVARRCTQQVTGVRTAVFNPRADYAVASGRGVINSGKCDASYGDQPATK
jgi:3D (Asp-Asp-Asp) domain-containing protein